MDLMQSVLLAVLHHLLKLAALLELAAVFIFGFAVKARVSMPLLAVVI